MSAFSSLEVRTIKKHSGLTDAFNRLRVSNPLTLFDSKQPFNDGDLADSVENSPQFFDNQETAGTGTATAYSANRASTILSVAATTTGTRVRQSKRRINYQPGKSQLAFLTGILGTGASGITRRYGLFDEQNGLFFELDDSTLYVVRRTYATGSAVDTRVAQTSWNIDPLDGTGVSGITLDLSKTQIFLIDFEWLGVGLVRFGVVVDGISYYCHEIKNTNVLGVVYMSTPNLPVRAEISNDGTGGAAELEMICSSVISEGGVEQTGISRSYNTGATAITMASTSTTYPLIGLRLRSSHLGLQVDPRSVGLLLTTTPDEVLWTLQINPTISGTPSWSNVNLSGTQAALGDGSLTVSANGEIVASDFISATVQARSAENIEVRINEKLGALIDGTPDQLWLCGEPLGSSTGIRARLNWTEAL